MQKKMSKFVRGIEPLTYRASLVSAKNHERDTAVLNQLRKSILLLCSHVDPRNNYATVLLFLIGGQASGRYRCPIASVTLKAAVSR